MASRAKSDLRFRPHPWTGDHRIGVAPLRPYVPPPPNIGKLVLTLSFQLLQDPKQNCPPGRPQAWVPKSKLQGALGFVFCDERSQILPEIGFVCSPPETRSQRQLLYTYSAKLDLPHPQGHSITQNYLPPSHRDSCTATAFPSMHWPVSTEQCPKSLDKVLLPADGKSQAGPAASTTAQARDNSSWCLQGVQPPLGQL